MRIFRTSITGQTESKIIENNFSLSLRPYFSQKTFFQRFPYYLFFTFGAGAFTTYRYYNNNLVFLHPFFLRIVAQASSRYSQHSNFLWDQLADRVKFLPTQQPEDPFLTFPALSSGPNKNRHKEEESAEWFLNMLPSSATMPSLFSLKEIISWGENASANTAPNHEPLKCCITVDCNSLDTAGMICMNGAIRQTASQPDLGETRYYYETHPKEFVNDPTQGPSEQRTAYVAALARWINRKECDSLSELKKHPEFEQYFDYRFGRLTPKLNVEKEASIFLKQHIDEIRLNVQRVKLDGTNHEAIQVLNFGLALGPFDQVANQRSPESQPYLREMCEIILIQEYKAVASVAVREARKHPEKVFPLSLTLVGGNMFGNPPESIKKGIEAACDVIRNSGTRNIIPVLSAYFEENVERYRTESFAHAPVLNEQDLERLQKMSDAFASDFSLKN